MEPDVIIDDMKLSSVGLTENSIEVGINSFRLSVSEV